MQSFIWVEKYSPKTIKQLILPKKLKATFNKMIELQEVPHLILHSQSPGTGKTSTARALLNDCNYEYIYVNCSNENGIDLLRTRIEKFSYSSSFEGKKKAIILDEFERATIALQEGLKVPLEQMYGKCSIIIICNNKVNIIDAIQSRMNLIEFNFGVDIYKQELIVVAQKYVKAILEREKVEFNPDVIDKFVNKFYPDLRTVLHRLQFISNSNPVITEDLIASFEKDNAIVDFLLNKKATSLMTYVKDRNYSFDDLYGMIYDMLLLELPKEKQFEFINLTVEYSDKSIRAFRKDIIFHSYILNVMSSLNS